MLWERLWTRRLGRKAGVWLEQDETLRCAIAVEPIGFRRSMVGPWAGLAPEGRIVPADSVASRVPKDQALWFGLTTHRLAIVGRGGGTGAPRDLLASFGEGEIRLLDVTPYRITKVLTMTFADESSAAFEMRRLISIKRFLAELGQGAS